MATTVDLHVHSVFSPDSSITIKDIVNRATKNGIDIVCITDHSIFDDNIELEAISKTEKYPIIIRGVELATDNGELIIFGLKNDFWEDLKKNMELLPSAQKVIDAVNDFNGVTIWAHPFRDYISQNYNTDYSSFKGINILEGFNGRNTKKENSLAINYAKANNFRITGGSDAHRSSNIGRCLTLFKNNIKTEVELINELKNGTYIPITLEDLKGKDLNELI